MATYPLDKLSVSVTDTGMSAPPFEDVLLSLEALARNIFGADIYLGADSQDGQMVATFAKAISDCNDACLAAYANMSPATAVGEGLSAVVKINGIERKPATNSQVVVTLTGAVGTIITDGQVGDSQGVVWNLPATVTIPVGGTINVTALAKDTGPITAEPSTLTRRLTPVTGWYTCNNAAAATPGQDVETDAALRRRQTQSVALAGRSLLGTIQGAVLDVSGVTAARVYENNTNSTDANGIPAKSLAVVVSGGAVNDIGDALVATHSPGVGWSGTTPVTRVNNEGQNETVRYTVTSLVTAKAALNITALDGYNSNIGDAIKASIVAHLDALGIGQKVFWSRVMTAAQLPLDPASAATFEINTLTLWRDSDTPLQSDVAIAFNEKARGVLADIALTVV